MDPDGSLWISGEYSLMRLSPDAPEALERYMERRWTTAVRHRTGARGPGEQRMDRYLVRRIAQALIPRISVRSLRSAHLHRCSGSRHAILGRGRGWSSGGDTRQRTVDGASGSSTASSSAAEVLPLPQLVDGRGRLWVTSSTFRGLFCYDIASPGPARPRLLRRFDLRKDLRGAWVMGVFEDRKQRIWIGLGDAGVAILDGVTLRTKQLIPRKGTVLRDSRIFHEDARGRFWVGDFNGGLSLLEDDDGDSIRYVRTFTTADGLPHDGIRSMAEAPDGVLWIGTRLGGIARYDGSGFTTISQREGLRSNAGWALAVGSDGRVWAGTDFGVEGIDPRTMQPFPTLKEMQGEKILRMGIGADSVLWAATAYAIHLYDIRGDVPNSVPPPVFITSFLVNGEPQSDNRRTDLCLRPEHRRHRVHRREPEGRRGRAV